MKKIKTKKWLLLGAVVIALLITMTISDNYYSNLNENYPLLQKEELLSGKITDIKIHHKYTFIELDSSTKRLITPSFLMNKKTAYLHKTIAIGDYLVYEGHSDKITLLKDNESYNFLVSHLFNEK